MLAEVGGIDPVVRNQVVVVDGRAGVIDGISTVPGGRILADLNPRLEVKQVFLRSPLTDSNRRPPPYHRFRSVTRGHARSRAAKFSCKSFDRGVADASRDDGRVVSDVSVLCPRPVVYRGNGSRLCWARGAFWYAVREVRSTPGLVGVWSTACGRRARRHAPLLRAMRRRACGRCCAGAFRPLRAQEELGRDLGVGQHCLRNPALCAVRFGSLKGAMYLVATCVAHGWVAGRRELVVAG